MMKIIKILKRSVGYATVLFKCERCNHECTGLAISLTDTLDCERCDDPRGSAADG